MEPTGVFSSKAEKYARYRWDYAPEAIQAIFDVTQISRLASVADIGAGTGILTRHFIGRVRQVFAVEPNAEMRGLAARALASYPSCHILDGRAEATGLPDHSVDLIAVAQAHHWFKPQPARAEFLRILKPGGWLAVLRNSGSSHELGEALGKIFPPETDTGAAMIGRGTPLSFYFGSQDYLEQTFPFPLQQTWEQFIGALSSASYAPEEGSPLYANFERGAREVFDRFRTGDIIVSNAGTRLCLGRVAG